jgi:uncharacterized OsmC-like protein
MPGDKVDGVGSGVCGEPMNLIGAARTERLTARRYVIAWNWSLNRCRDALRHHPLGAFIILKIAGEFMDIRTLQRPLKEQYRQNPSSSRITLKARGSQTDAPITCSVDLGREIYKAQAHQGVGGTGTGACSGDLLLGAIAACAQITCQMVAAAMGIPTEAIDVTVEGDLDLQGTLGISKEAAVGFESIRVIFDVRAPQATKEQLSALQEKTEQYCVVMQTLEHPPKIDHRWGKD